MLDLYYRECAELAAHLSQGAGRVGVSDELVRRTREYAAHFPEAAASLPSRHRHMPYRAYLRLVAARLKSTYDDHAFPYESPNELVADLELSGRQLARE